LHFTTTTTTPPRTSAVFCKTALNWANENNDRFMALELLKLERGIHPTEVEGLECLRAHLSSDALLPWIIESYGKFYDQPGTVRWCEAFLTVFTALVLLSYLPFIIDIYSDANLVLSYGRFAFGSEHLNLSELLSCGATQLNSSCYDQTGSDHPLPPVLTVFANASYDDFDAIDAGFPQSGSDENIRHMFEVAYWTTTASIFVSSVFYIFCVAFDASPSFIAGVPERIALWGRKRGWSECSLTWLGWLARVSLTVVCKLFWPLVHIGRRLRYQAAVKRSEHKATRVSSDEAWFSIKTVEHGIEASLQLFLQLWLLRPFLPGITAWDSTELVTREVFLIFVWKFCCC
jgi:hypothetical protein